MEEGRKRGILLCPSSREKHGSFLYKMGMDSQILSSPLGSSTWLMRTSMISWESQRKGRDGMVKHVTRSSTIQRAQKNKSTRLTSPTLPENQMVEELEKALKAKLPETNAFETEET